MELYISRQLVQLVCSFALGFGIGLAYDLLRILRRRLGADALFDALFWFCCLLALFTLGMDMGEGSLHIFMLAFAIIGFAAYMLLISGFTMVILDKTADMVSRALSPVKKYGKIFSKVVKKFFSNIRYRFTIVAHKRKKGKGGQDEKNIDSVGTGAGGTDRVCYPEPHKRSEGSEGRNGADSAASRRDSGGTDGKQPPDGKHTGTGKRRGRRRAGKAAAETDKTG